MVGEGIFLWCSRLLVAQGTSQESCLLIMFAPVRNPNKLIDSPSWNPFGGPSCFLQTNIDSFL